MFERPDRLSDNGGNEVKHHYKMWTLCHAECRRFGSFATSDQNLADKVLSICCLQINLISPEAIDSFCGSFLFFYVLLLSQAPVCLQVCKSFLLLLLSTSFDNKKKQKTIQHLCISPKTMSHLTVFRILVILQTVSMLLWLLFVCAIDESPVIMQTADFTVSALWCAVCRRVGFKAPLYSDGGFCTISRKPTAPLQKVQTEKQHRRRCPFALSLPSVSAICFSFLHFTIYNSM